jgi:TPR repeat protein
MKLAQQAICFSKGYTNLIQIVQKLLALYLRASDLGSSWAQNRIGWFYMTGSHVVSDFKKAKIHLSRAAKQNNKTAIENRAILKSLQNKEKTSK